MLANLVLCRAVAKLAESPEFHLSKVLQPGDIEIVHNPTIFHTRGPESTVCLELYRACLS